ncbi:hypothetical protein ACJMK2_043355 [Sinanodonta woodiana]|uniref:Uncharacterized protein n=1 Tax=Sinanodonta woodiana TaxID=1069815 RepID=A0ABD3VWM4_SINWO
MCQLCNVVVSFCDNLVKSFTRSPLNNHLSYKDPTSTKQVIHQKATASASASSTNGIQQTGRT